MSAKLTGAGKKLQRDVNGVTRTAINMIIDKTRWKEIAS
jgi:hypothetical protein